MLATKVSKATIAKEPEDALVLPSISAKPRKPAARKDGAPTRPVRGRRSPEDVQARILNAAVFEFAEHSFSGARIDKISKRAKTVDRMLYYYFGSKERLYQAVLEHVFSKLILEQHNFVVDENDPIKGMRELVMHSWQHYHDNPELVRLLVTENLLRAKYFKKLTKIKSTTMPLVSRVEELLAAGVQGGVFRPDADPQQVLLTAMSLGFFYLSNQYTCTAWMGVNLMEKERCDAWGSHISDVVLSYLTRQS